MRSLLLILLASSSLTTLVVAFSSNRVEGLRKERFRVVQRTVIPSSQSSTAASKKFVSNQDGQDCGCEQTVFSGKAREDAIALNHREAIRDGILFGPNSQEVRMDDLLENTNSGNSISIVVFLRSLG